MSSASPTPDELLEVVFRAVDNGLCAVNHQGEVLRANAVWLQSMQLTAAEAIGRSLNGLAPEHAARIMAARADATHAPVRLPARPRLEGGVWQDTLSRVGEGWLIATRAHVEPPALSELEALAAALAALPIAVSILETDADGQLLAVAYNAAQRRMLGSDHEDRLPPRYRLYRPDRSTEIAPSDWPGVRAAVGGMVVHETTVHMHREDGAWIVAQVCAAPVAASGGETRRVVVVAIDDTERFEAERALSERESTYRAVFENIRDAIALIEAQRDARGDVIGWRCIEANEATAAQLGLTRAELIGRSIAEVSPARQSVLAEGCARVLASGEPWRYETRLGDAHLLVKVFRLDEQRVGSAAVDITSIRVAEAALRRSEMQLRLLIEHAPAGVALFDRQLRYLAVSKRYAVEYRVDSAALIGRSYYDVFPEIPERWKDTHRRCLAGASERCAEDRFVRADGSVDWIEWEIQPWLDADGTVGGLVMFSVVITERKHAADMLLATKERLAVTLSSIGDAVVATDEQNRITLLNRAAEQLIGWSASEAAGRRVADVLHIVHEDTGEPVRSPADVALEQGTVVALANHSALILRDGSTRPIADSAAPIRDAAGRIVGVVLVLRDQTDARRTEQALERSRGELLSLVEKLPLGVFVIDHGQIVYANPTFADYCGVAAEALIGRRPAELAATGAHNLPAEDEEWVISRADGSSVTLACSSAPEIIFDGRPASLWTCRDMSQLHAMQAQLLHADRLATVGMLAAGAAHEINNPLAYVIAALDVIEEQLLPLTAASPALELETVFDSLRAAHHGAQRVKAIVRDLKAFSRAEQDVLVPVDLRASLDSAISMAMNEIKHRARVIKRYEAAPTVAANEARLGQVFLNLLVNAAHAIPGGQPHLNEIRVSLWTDEQGCAVVEVTDTGEGIPDEIRDRIFDPFFTTKAGAGTGLGLAISRNTVVALGGTITLESGSGLRAGSVARVTLPLGAATFTGTRSSGPAPAPPASPVARRVRVMIVDDEVAIGAMLNRLLQRDHDVVVESSSRAAWARIERGERYDVIFCDVMMPEPTGMQLYQHIRERAPDQAERIVFMTGGTFTPAAEDFLARVRNTCIQKPFDSRRIRELLRQVKTE